jgi:hypothetical protein
MREQVSHLSTTRRQFITSLGGASVSTALGLNARAEQSLPQAILPLVVDSSVNVETAAPALARRGVKVIMRYYARDPVQPGYEDKRLTQQEARVIHANGMAIGLGYQRYNGQIASFSRAEALAAAAYCIGRDSGLNPGKPEVIKHPLGTTIYFGVDTNQFTDEQMKTVVAYFEVIKERFDAANAPFKIGVYGSGASCERVNASRAKVDRFWLAGVSAGWKRTREFYNGSTLPWNLFQNALEVPLEILVDTNLVNPAASGKLGAFTDNGLLGSLDDAHVRTALRFIKPPQGDAKFYKMPGGEKIEHTVEIEGQDVVRDFVEQRRMVSVIEEGPEWTKIEATFAYKNVGTVNQGYVRTSILAPITQMP